MPMNDTTTDGDQTYTITVSVGATADTVYLTIPDRTISVINADDDIPGFTVSKTQATTQETPTQDTFTVRLNKQPTAAVTIPITSSDISEGLVGTSVTEKLATLSLSFTTTNWSTAQTVYVHGVSDAVDDGNQTYAVTVGAPSGASEYAALLSKSVSVTNEDDDTAGITVAAGAPTLVTSENGTIATFTVKLNTEPASSVTVPVTSGNPAEGRLSSGAQNGLATVNLTFTKDDWNAAQTVTVTGQDEAGTPVPSDNEAYNVTVGKATGDALYASLAAQAVHVLNTDNDTAAVIVPAVGGTPLQTRETGTRTATFTVAINKLPAADLLVPITVSDVTEALVQGGESPTTPLATLNVRFTAANWQDTQTVTVIGQPDTTADGNQPYSITVGAPTGDAAYSGVAAQVVDATNVDTNVAGFTVTPTSLWAYEGGAVKTFTVALNVKPETTVTVPVSVGATDEVLVAGGGSGGLFVQSLNLTFTPINWSTPQTVQVQSVADHIDDGDFSVGVTVGPTAAAAGTPFDGLPQKSVSVLSADQDASQILISPASVSTTEAGGTATFTVTLASIPMGTVTIPISVDDDSEALLSSGGSQAVSLSLSFTGSDWNQPKTVTVTGQQDGELDGARPFKITLGKTTGGDSFYNALQALIVTGTNADDEVGVSEGTPTPVALTLGTPRAGQVGPSSSSYYVVTATNGSFVSVGVAGLSAGVTLTVDDDGNYAAGTLCTVTVASASGSCLAMVPLGGTLYVRVSTASIAGAGYVLTAAPRQVYTSTDVPKAIPDGNSTGVTSSLVVSGGATFDHEGHGAALGDAHLRQRPHADPHLPDGHAGDPRPERRGIWLQLHRHHVGRRGLDLDLLWDCAVHRAVPAAPGALGGRRSGRERNVAAQGRGLLLVVHGLHHGLHAGGLVTRPPRA